MKTLAFAALAAALAVTPALAHGTTAAFGEAGHDAQVTRTITVEAAEMYFNPDEINVKLGETIKFVIVNKGRKSHEFVLGDLDYQEAHMKEMAAMPGMEMSEPNEASLNPGETKAVIWHFTRKGDFMFACDYPGHADAGMEGEIHVK